MRLGGWSEIPTDHKDTNCASKHKNCEYGKEQEVGHVARMGGGSGSADRVRAGMDGPIEKRYEETYFSMAWRCTGCTSRWALPQRAQQVGEG